MCYASTGCPACHCASRARACAGRAGAVRGDEGTAGHGGASDDARQAHDERTEAAPAQCAAAAAADPALGEHAGVGAHPSPHLRGGLCGLGRIRVAERRGSCRPTSLVIRGGRCSQQPVWNPGLQGAMAVHVPAVQMQRWLQEGCGRHGWCGRSACCSAAAMRPGAAAAGPGPAPSGGAPGACDAALAAYGSRFCMRCLTYGCLTHPGPHPRRGPARRAPAHAGRCQARERAEVSVPAAAQAAQAAAAAAGARGRGALRPRLLARRRRSAQRGGRSRGGGARRRPGSAAACC